MGMSISAKLVYGLWYEDLVEGMDEDAVELINEEIYDGEWESCSPHYDDGTEKSFIGIQMGEFIDVDSLSEFEKDLRECEERFKIRFGKTGYAIAAKNIY